MPRREHAAQRQISPWRLYVCFFLAMLFLHNPFFTIYGSSHTLKVQHPLSYRGTVACSELRRSRVTEVQPKVSAPEEAILEAAEPSAPTAADTRVPPQEPLDFRPQVISESSWFRPPPVS